MTENELLKKVYDLVLASEACPHLLPAQWMSMLLYMHRRGWLYCSIRGNELFAVAGAFRICSWDEKFREKLPEREEGSTLYIPFVASDGSLPVAVPRLLRYCLRQQPGVQKVVYYRKSEDRFRERFRVVDLASRPGARRQVIAAA